MNVKPEEMHYKVKEISTQNIKNGRQIPTLAKRSNSVSRKEGSVFSEEKKLVGFYQDFRETCRVEKKFFDKTDRQHYERNKEEARIANKFSSRYLAHHCNPKSVRNTS